MRHTSTVARLRIDFFSDALELGTAMTVLLPQRTTAQIGLAGAATDDVPPVLYLLHGLSDDDTAWSRWTSIERYAADLGLAVVMPQVHRSFYADEAHGGRFWQFLSTELPDLVARFFRVSTAPADTFVAGLSMGGYGALKWALRQPERFAAAASLSGALDLPDLQAAGQRSRDLDRVFAGPAAGTPDDLLHVLARADPADLPAIYAACGTEDPLYPHTARFADACRDRGIPLTARAGAGGHDWAYWDAEIRRVLDWLPLRR
jgi:S-formylglutathione hydrolase FrmB